VTGTAEGLQRRVLAGLGLVTLAIGMDLALGISLKLLDVAGVKVGNFLPALVFAPALVALVSLFG
jgi:uncharacterized membrane protein YqgA involved in biofilm formation